MADPDSLSGVTVFVAAARAGSFTQAAERLAITKSAVGKAIARLEERLGLKLFFRTTRRIRLTPDGEAYFAACSGALDDIAAAEAALTSANRVISGRLRVDMPVAFGRQVLLPILLEISRPHPGLSLTLSFTDALTDPFQEDVELLIRFGPLRDSSHLVARHLVDQARIICAAPSYLDQHGVPKGLNDLRDHRGVVGSRHGPPLSWVVAEDGQERRISPPATHQLSDGDAMVQAAVAGFGLCQAPASLVRRHLDDGSLVAVLADYSTVPVAVNALWPKQAHLSPRVRYVVDQLVKYAAAGRLD
ncbi:LysR family transcriptional regulator [Caulobacter endophyticus]|uniref:LysR family transcriptional regulator n=1 Tax=Caulobacter endophyticus TaxID=2172652 RepID=A0A2T9JEL8_9CAUL|nr:LysR family transcriptional regulator [Caulobacter endophyticus]PVM82135.1 LysR family transcriptional regulator [Caulobacter endophyticus]